MPAQALRDALRLLGAQVSDLRLAVYSRSVMAPGRGTPHRRMPDNANAAAHELFAVLREFDALGIELIWIELPPAGAEWDGVRDRLMRAAAA